jgi:transposase, IS5 family
MGPRAPWLAGTLQLDQLSGITSETMILPFRWLLATHQPPEWMLALVRWLLEAQGFPMETGTIEDATIIDAPSSTNNATGIRDPEMEQTRNENTWYFGMKIHGGTD